MNWYLATNSLYHGYQLPETKDLIRILSEHIKGKHNEAWFINQVKEISDSFSHNKGKTLKKSSLATRMDAVIEGLVKQLGGDNFEGTIANPVSNKSEGMADILDDLGLSATDFM